MGSPPPSPMVIEVAEHPDHRQIATFFLGCVFLAALQCLVASGLHRIVYRRVSSSPSRSLDSEKASFETLGASGARAVHPALSFVLSLCFLFATIGQLISLMSFDSGGNTSCAFGVAWGGLSAQFGRLAGLSIILVALRQLGVGNRETLICVTWLLAGLVLVFATFAVGTGSVSKFDKLGIFLCDHKHILGLSLTSSFMYSVIEVYAIGRVLTLTYSHTRDPLVWLFDSRVLQAVSLLILELLAMVPAALFTGILGEFVPFSVGAVIVLLTFKPHRQAKAQVVTIPQGRSDAAALRDLYLASRTISSTHSQQPDSHQFRDYEQPALIGHPYSAKNLADATIVDSDEKWTPGYRQARNSRRSSRTIDSRSPSMRSAGEAIVQVARRTRNPWANPSSSDVPALPPITFEPSMSSVRPRLVMVNSARGYIPDDTKPGIPPSLPLALPDHLLEDPKSRFSMTSTSPSGYITSDVSLPASPYPPSQINSHLRVQSDTIDLAAALPPPPLSPLSPIDDTLQSRVVSIMSEHLSVSSEDGAPQIVTIMPRPPLPIMAPVLRPLSDTRPRQFRAAGYANPIPLPKFRRDMNPHGPLRNQEVTNLQRADVPRSVDSESS